MEYKKPKHLIFDLGGVIINLDTSLTVRAFADLAQKTAAEINQHMSSEPAFAQYERGEIACDEFRNAIRKLAGRDLEDERIDEAWNAMILDLPHERIDLLRRLGHSFDIFLLSNTNTIHLKRVGEVREAAGIVPFGELFQKDYYSHLMGKRKPEAACFRQVIDENGLDPAHTLFLDDSETNIEGASAVGLQTLHVTSPDVMTDYFEHE